MFAARTSALRALSRNVAARTVARTARHNSTHATPTGGSSDLPWLIASIGITIPAVSLEVPINAKIAN